SSTAVSEQVAGAVVGEIRVVDRDSDDSHVFAVSDDRFEVVNGQLQLRSGASLSFDNASVINIEVTATDAAGASISESFAIEVLDVQDPVASNGFLARYLGLNDTQRSLDDINWSDAALHEESIEHIDYVNGGGSFWEGGLQDTFAAQISGYVEVSQGGTYNFHLGADDGAELYVNGQLVIDHGGLHAFSTRSIGIELSPGAHEIEVRYFEHYGQAGLRLEWDGPGTNGRELVSAYEGDILDTNTAPEDIVLSSTAVSEQVAGAVVGEIRVVDRDSDGSHVFAVSDDRFEVANGQNRTGTDSDTNEEEGGNVYRVQPWSSTSDTFEFLVDLENCNLPDQKVWSQETIRSNGSDYSLQFQEISSVAEWTSEGGIGNCSLGQVFACGWDDLALA
ncbi:PA14 domain-containing protein, partial [uncultured Tateyamaria sp.]|uniref:PA14 domain-containing protein n=1 Tax=uncultured Tateyamaria sp. TaxID=455651 RepID=UPI00260C8F03